MEIYFTIKNNNIIELGNSSNMDVVFNDDNPIEIPMEKDNSLDVLFDGNNKIDIQFATKVIANGGIIRLTSEEYEKLKEKNDSIWYFVTDSNGNLIEIYIGKTLISRADSDGNMNFPYTFPFKF